MANGAKITHFTHLDAWKVNHKLVLMVYKLTEKFPRREIYGLTSQLRRAVSSITANIAEGYGRYHFNDKIRFYIIAKGSSTEAQNFLIIAKDLSYMEDGDFQQIKVVCFEGYKLINGLIRSTAKLADNSKQ